MSSTPSASSFDPQAFAPRHLGSSPADIAAMLAEVGYPSLDALADATVPAGIRLRAPMDLPAPASQARALAELEKLAARNQPLRSLIGAGYYGSVLPPVLQRNILENPGWYTQYTPYQAEISQGRLEALLNFQTMITELTALPVANASLLDEATAAGEAMAMCLAVRGGENPCFYASPACHPQTLAVLRTRAEALGIELIEEDFPLKHQPSNHNPSLLGVLVQYPTTDGRIENHGALVEAVHAAGGLVVAACDLLALTVLTPPGRWGAKGADIAVGSTQRFGLPMGLGGPHAGYMAVKQELLRRMPGRLVGVSKDAQGKPAYRLSLQTREQHIRREKATSNICTAQALPAILASMYAVHHGPEGLRAIALRVCELTTQLALALKEAGLETGAGPWFDTIKCKGTQAKEVMERARAAGFNLRAYADGAVGVSLDELSDEAEVERLVRILAGERPLQGVAKAHSAADALGDLLRPMDYLAQPVFHQYHAEHELLRYIKRLESRDLSLTTSMIPLGSCTMKLNPAAAMLPITWPNWANIHPFAPTDQWQGYAQVFSDLDNWLGEITGLPGVWLQPNAGSQGEYAGLLVIRAHHHARHQPERDICLIPVSAHGTNPASAVIAGFQVVPVACDALGNVNLQDLRAKAQQHKDRLGALMITYPSTHGVFEAGVVEACKIVHDQGGMVYMDGANMNAQVGLTSPGAIGADVCHLNLHKTFCIPHGGGGPGMGPICVSKTLEPHLGKHPLLLETDASLPTPLPPGEGRGEGSPSSSSLSSSLRVSAADYGSALVLLIPWMYIRMMGTPGLTQATQLAILNANYMAHRLQNHFPIVYRGQNQRVAHEFIIDCREFETTAGIKVEDIAKRLMDFGFHAPTMSWPVPGTLMIEPTESESKAELDRLCQALLTIRQEIDDILAGRSDRNDNPLKHAPHTAHVVTADQWNHAYPRSQAAYPAPWLAEHKFWPAVSRIDNAYGDRNLICTCAPMPPA